MGDFPNKATQFSSSNQPKKNDRKKKIYTVLKEMGFTADDVRTAFGEIAFHNISDVIELAKNEAKPIIVRIAAKAFIKAYEAGDWAQVKDIMEHFIGKAPAVVGVITDEDEIKQIFKIGDQEIEF